MLRSSKAIIPFPPMHLPKLTLTAPDGASAEVYLHGAHITSWKPANGEERLFVSQSAEFQEGIAIRGGVPVVFPQFSGLGALAKHGFARNTAWELIETTGDSATLQLRDSEATRALWPYPFRIELKVIVGGQQLEMKLRIINTGDSAFTFTTALHTYLRIQEITNTTVEGLQGLQYLNVVTGEQIVDTAARVVFHGDIDRSYYQAGSRSLRLIEPHRTLTVTSQGFPDAVVWNPGEVTASKIKDLETGGYQRFVCIEAAAIEQPISLSPGQVWEGSQLLSA